MSEHWSDDGDELDVSDELTDEWLAEWDEAEREAVEVLRNALPGHQAQPPPADQLRKAAESVRRRLREGGHPLDWVRQAAGMENDPAPDEDAELLVRLAAATISPQEETGLDVEEEALLTSLEHADWLGAIVSEVRDGPGADASPYALVDAIRTCPEVNDESGIDADDESHIATAFSIIALPWQVLGLIDADQRLTELGQWILPRALARAWGGEFDQEPSGGGG
ncbi:MAG TPA: hypothetical protein VE127_02500 [Solirubrobacteraceae bacterium]|nr:hypothetical protein [Solirubrobacteraceae bacterium]